ncbi:MAG: GNAT family N-acetyltransferase [Anaerolineae bacterium]
MTLHVEGPHLNKGSVCAPILRALPQWFGIEEATRHYIESIDTLPTFLATEDDAAIGFLSVQRHYPQSAEIYVMGVLPQAHRQGVGRALLAAAEGWLAGESVRFLQVKTLSPRHPDEGYKKTRAFYAGVGFVPLEEFPTLWGEHNPCLMLIKYLA